MAGRRCLVAIIPGGSALWQWAFLGRSQRCSRGSGRVDISDFLLNLRIVAASPYAFAAYVGVAAAWTYTTVARHRLDRIAQLFKDLPPDDRIRMIMREYSTVPRSGLSAEQWIVSRRHTLFFRSEERRVGKEGRSWWDRVE